MAERRSEESGADGPGIPRDLPDQQADSEGGAPDRWEGERPAEPGKDAPGSPEELPDTDEAGTGRRGNGRKPAVNPEQPDPDESAG